MKRFLSSAFVLAVLAAVSTWSRQDGPSQPSAVAAEGGIGWKTVAPGMALRFLLARKEGVQSNSRVAVLRIDPARWDLEVVGTSRTGESTGHTTRDWCQRHNLTAGINAGMFGRDQKTHVGYLRYREHVSSRSARNPKNVLACPCLSDRKGTSYLGLLGSDP
jgi:hypothetical protein